MTPYRDFRFGAPHAHRPYVVIDMIATVDGKTVSGDIDESVSDLGSATDHAVMRRLQDLADGVLIGAGTLRATPTGWDPKTRFRVVVSQSGKVDFGHSFFQGAKPILATTSNTDVPSPLQAIRFDDAVKPEILLEELRRRGCERLLVLGGSHTNGMFLQADVVDEIFVTVAPKIKLGETLPTLASGPAFAREDMLALELVEHHAVGNEIFLRYRRAAAR